MKKAAPAADLKKTSVLRRVPPFGAMRYSAEPAFEGDISLFELPREALPIVVEAISGRALTLAPGDRFLATSGYRESTRWVVGRIPDGGLIAGQDYWMLAESGIVGDLIADSPLEKGHLGQVKYLGTVCDERGEALNIRQFAAKPAAGGADHGAPLFLVLGTSAEVGKTTAGIAVLSALRHQGHAIVIVLKATGTSSLAEIVRYQDFGAAQVFDCIDFGLPTTYPSQRDGIDQFFDAALTTCLSIEADAVVIECGGDMLGANVPVFLERLKARRKASSIKVILAAADALAALGAKRVLHDMGLSINLITGPCTDTPTVQQRTLALCGIAAVNLAQGTGLELAL